MSGTWSPLLLLVPKFGQEILKKKVLAYLIERYFGHYFLKKLNLDQLDLHFGKDTGCTDSTCTLKNISLDTTHLNELAEKQNWPIEFLDGYVETLQATVPVTTLLKNPTYFEITGLSLTIQPKQRSQPVPTSMFDSMWSSISSSNEVVQDCAKQLASEGIDYVYQKIEAVISRVKVKFVDTVIHVEHVPENSSNGVGITMHVDIIEYSDEAGKDPTRDESTKLSDQDPKKANFTQSLTSKLFTVEGITFSTFEFLSKNRTIPKSNLCQSSYESEDDDSDVSVEGAFREASDSFENCREQFQEDQKIFDEEQLNGPRHAKEGHHVVVFASLSGAQQIKVSLKQSEDSVGPKVSIVANFGILALFLSPRQVHLLVEFANGFSSPDMENDSRTPVSKCTTKPLSKCDEQTVEEALLQRLQAPDIHGLQGLQAAAYGWSASDQAENDTDDIFLPMNNAVSGMYESALSGNSSSMASSVSSSMASSATELSHQTRRRLSNVDSDPTAEISHFEVKIATLAVVLLHEDLMQQSAETDQLLLLSSVQVMQQSSNEFFRNIGSFVVSESEEENFKNASAAISRGCPLSHLRLLAATVEIEENEKVTSSAFSVVGQLTTAKLELNEFSVIGSLQDLEEIPLLRFVETAPNDSEKSCLKVNFKHAEKTSRNMIRKGSGPRTDISLSLTKCNVEADVTIIDRLSALLAFPTICMMEKSSWNSRIAGAVPMTLPTITKAESKMDLKLACPKLNVYLRFPVPDFRPVNCMDRTHWWERNVRPDFLSIVFSDILMQTTFQTEQTFQEFSIHSKVIDIYYSENEKHNPHHLAKAYCNENFSFPKDDKFQNRLSIKVFPTKNNDLEECQEPELDPMTQSCYGAFAKQTNVDPGPFCSKKLVHHSDNPHTKPQEENSSELLLPGEKHEIDEFIQSTSSSSKIQVEISLPLISAQLSSKHIFEVLYNRINNELLMWTPSAPKPKTKPYNYKTQWATRKDGRNIYSMCESAPLFSDSDVDSEEESDTSNIFYSTHDRQTNRSQNQDISINEQSNFTLNLQIGRGMVYMNPPVRDSASNVVPGQQGKFLFNLKNATIFLVSGYKGDNDLGYVCVQSHCAELFHCDMQAIPSKIPSLKEIGSIIGKHLQSTIYKSDAGMLAASKERGGNREMLTVAIKIRDNYTVTRHEIVVVDAKSIQVSVGLNKCTLKHRTVEEPNGWISHLLDFFNLTDYPIPNYVAKDVLTEINLHLWDCAIDYRPLHLPIRSAITMGTFSICMNMSAQPNASTATFTLGECVLFLSERGPPKKGVASSVAVNLTQDYFSVAHLGLLEISLKTNEKVTAGNPRIDLRILNNNVRITTCADSGKMLIDLLVYLSNKGDLTHTPPDTESSPFSSPKHYVEQELVKPDPHKTSELTRSRQDHMVGELLDAMKEPVIVEQTRMLPADVAAMKPPTEVATGMPSTEVAPERLSTEITPGNPSAEVAPKILSTEVAPGMLSTEVASGMLSTEVASGILSTEVASEILITEVTSGMSSTEVAPGMPSTEVEQGMPPIEIAPKIPSTEVAPRMSSTEFARGLLSTEVAPSMSSTEVAPRISSTEIASRISPTEVASRISSTEIASRISSTEVASRISSTGVPTTRIYFAGERRRPPRDGRLYQRNLPGNSDALVTRDLGDVCTYRHYWSSDTDEEYVVVANEPGLFPKNGEPEIKWLTADPVRVVNDHFTAPEGKVDILEAPKTFPNAVIRYSLRDMSVVWYTFGGHDFELPSEKKDKKKGVHFSDKQSSARVFYGGSDSRPVSNSLGDQNKKIPWLYRGGVNRRQDIRMEFYLNKVRFSYEVYPESTLQASRLVLTISDFSITDKLQESKINKFLYHYTSEDKPKRSRAHMMVVKALYIRPDTMRNVQECCLKVSMLPLRFNIDQDSLLFLITFFGELGGGSSNGNEMNFNKPSTPPIQHPPILALGRDSEELLMKQAALKTVDENLIMLTSRYQPEPVSSCTLSSSVHSTFPDDSPVYIRFFEFSPDVLIRLDYHGKRVDFTHGSLHGLLMGLAQLNCSELVLKILHNRQGILGFDKLMGYIVQEFHNDIKNQLPRLLGGVGPMHAVLQLFQGIKDFLWMPIEQFQKDGRIVRGIQRGTNSFTTSTTKAALELTCQLINLIQATAETAYDVLSPGPSLKRIAMAKKKKKRYSQPQDIREGVANALSIVRDGIGDTASNLVQVATYEKEQKGYSGAVGGVLREIPSTIVKPILVVAGATSDILGGVRNQLVPDARREANEKWRTDFE